MSDLASISVSLAGRGARLFGISEPISERAGARGTEEGGGRMDRISAGRVKYFCCTLAVQGRSVIYTRSRVWLWPQRPVTPPLPPCLPPCPATTTTTRTKVLTTSTIRPKVFSPRFVVAHRLTRNRTSRCLRRAGRVPSPTTSAGVSTGRLPSAGRLCSPASTTGSLRVCPSIVHRAGADRALNGPSRDPQSTTEKQR